MYVAPYTPGFGVPGAPALHVFFIKQSDIIVIARHEVFFYALQLTEYPWDENLFFLRLRDNYVTVMISENFIAGWNLHEGTVFKYFSLKKCEHYFLTAARKQFCFKYEKL